MSFPEGTGTEANAPPQEEVENKMDAPPYQGAVAPPYQPAGQQQVIVQQIQPVDPSATQVVVVPNNVQTTTQTLTYAGNNNVTQFGVQGSAVVNSNLSYFQPREDTGEYQENMKPWETDGQNYSFACCTEYVDTFDAKQGKKASFNATVQWIHTVYHKTGSNRLIIKRKAATSALAQARNNPMTKWALAIGALGVVLIIVGGVTMGGGEEYYDSYTGEYEEDSNGASIGTLVGGVVLILAAFVLICCFQKGKVAVQDSDMVTQSIPIDSMFYVERQVSQQAESDQCCCAPPKQQAVQYSEIAIGYNRSNLSVKLQGSASTEDFVKFSLISNQAYNLHGYINCILDGTHPQTNGDVAPGSAARMNSLPRTSAFQQPQ